ncbi:MAG: amino acid racemase [Deltaproteobacteria bacterium]|jgi:aspartate racemase|nr:amino acid racemase [Deltaproteobacteria bacterium]
MPKEQVIGVVGGMGPEATVELLHHIIRLTPASEDSDHIRCVVDSNTKPPAHIKALGENSGLSPVAGMCDTARRLEAWGVDFLVMPCNTAHYCLDELQAAVSIPVLNLLDIAVAAARKRVPGLRRVGLLATTDTVRTGLYADRFARAGVVLLVPDAARQQQTLDLIAAIKAGRTGSGSCRTLRDLADHLAGQGAQAVVLGCTELGLAADGGTAVPFVDTVVELARAAVLRVKGKTTEDD